MRNMDLPHIKDAESFEARIRGGIRAAFNAHESPDVESIAKRVSAELRNDSLPHTPKPRKKRPVPDQLIKDIRGLRKSIANAAKWPDRAESVADSVIRRIEGLLERHTILE